MRLYLGLVHYPVYNRNYQTIASAVTTFDIHDIARLAKTYDVRRFFIITPLDDQKALIERVKNHWTNGYGAGYNPHRKEAIRLVDVAASLEEAAKTIMGLEADAPIVIATDAAKQDRNTISYRSARDLLEDERVVFLIFGTAWGLDKTALDQADFILDPISGRAGYQHLSVRSAAAIILDRLACMQDTDLEEENECVRND